MSKVIRSLTDPAAVSLLRLSFDKKLRYAWRKCIISSPTLISELSGKYEFEDIILDKKPKGDLPYKCKNIHIVSPRILERIGQLKHSRLGILATLLIPTPLSVESFDARGMLVLNGIGDVGELGTILRSACAFGWKSVWITHSCGDPFDPVCIRSSQGALFSLPYRVGSIENALKHCRETKGISKLKFSPSTSSGVRLGMNNINLSETFLAMNSEFCLLVDSEQKQSSTDFKSIQLSPTVSHPNLMPIATSVSTLLMLAKRLAEWQYSRDERVSQKKMQQTIICFQNYDPPSFVPTLTNKSKLHTTTFNDRLKRDLADREMKKCLNQLLNQPEENPIIVRKKTNAAIPRYHLPREAKKLFHSPRIPKINKLSSCPKTVMYTSVGVFDRLAIGRKNLFLAAPILL